MQIYKNCWVKKTVILKPINWLLTKKGCFLSETAFCNNFFLKNYFTFSAKAAPALNLTTFLAAILISLPV